MLIISKFHDYYDRAIGYGGIDKSTVYNRKTEYIEKRHRIYGVVRMNGRPNFHHCEILSIGFCGNMYPLVVIYGGNCCSDEIIHCFYTVDSLKEFMKDNRVVWNLSNTKYNGRYYHGFSIDYQINNGELDPNNWNKYKYIFTRYKCPTFIIGNGLGLNPRLVDYFFYKVFDPFTAFQEIHMYLSGVIGNPEKNLIEIEDKDQLKKKGFNEWSFKKLPGGKKRRKNK